MKKITFTLLVLSFLNLNSYSQQGLGFGLGGSINTTWILNQNAYGDAELAAETKWGTDGHITIGYNFLPVLGVWTGIGMMKLGQDYKGTQNNLDATRTIDLLYTSLPLLVRLNVGGEKTRFHFMVGPNFTFLRKATQDYRRAGNVVTDAIVINGIAVEKGKNVITDRFEKNNTMLLIDLGVDYFVTNELYISLGLRANYGFKDINATDWRIPNSAGEYSASKNAAAGITLGVNYLLRKD
jgi:hypothetical protein